MIERIGSILLSVLSVYAITVVEVLPQNNSAPLSGRILKFSDEYGQCSYRTEILHYKSIDGASIEASILLPDIDKPRAGLVFVHMWSRDRHTFWGLPEFLASHGFPCIYMDLRGHGNSRMPNSDEKISLDDKYKRYKEFYLDIIPAIDILNTQKMVVKNRLILIAGSLGCPLGALAVEKNKEKFIGMIHMAPALDYFDVNCTHPIKNLKKMPVYVIIEKTDKSYRSGMQFFNNFDFYKTILMLDRIGHGTDVLYYDLGVPKIILSWVQNIEKFEPVLKILNEKKIKKE